MNFQFGFVEPSRKGEKGHIRKTAVDGANAANGKKEMHFPSASPSCSSIQAKNIENNDHVLYSMFFHFQLSLDDPLVFSRNQTLLGQNWLQLSALVNKQATELLMQMAHMTVKRFHTVW